MAWAEVCKKKKEEKRTDAEKDSRWQNKSTVLNETQKNWDK